MTQCFISTAIPQPILNIVDANTINLTIQRVRTKGVAVLGYDIYVLRTCTDDNKSWQTVANLTTNVQTYLVDGLEPNTRYAFRVCVNMESGGEKICSAARETITPKMG